MNGRNLSKLAVKPSTLGVGSASSAELKVLMADKASAAYFF